MVVRRAEKVPPHGGEDHCLRDLIHENDNAAFQKHGGGDVSAFDRHDLRKDKMRRVFQILDQRARAADGVRVDRT